MSTDVNTWQVDEINSGLNEDFNSVNGFSSLGMEISNTFNMKFVVLIFINFFHIQF